MSTTEHPVPQYLRSEHPDVLESVAARNRARDEWERDVKAYVDEHGEGSRFYAGLSVGRLVFGGLASPPATGKWAKSRNGYRPHKRSPLYEVHEALTRKDLRVVGLPTLTLIDSPQGMQVVSYQVFVHAGVAWARAATSGAVTNPGDAPDLEVWREVMASEWHAAQEAHDELVPS